MKSTKDILIDLIQIDTQNHKANETDLVKYIIDFCDRCGAKYEVLSNVENRQNIIITVGEHSENNLVVLGHTDVVSVEEGRAWSCDPFKGEIKDGYLYGRGSLDMKYLIASSLKIIEQLKQCENTLKRGIHFVFTADEENGSEYGMEFLLQNEDVRKLLANKIVLNEGGGFALRYDNKLYYLYETGQKSVARIKLTVPTNKDFNPYFLSLEHEKTLVQAIRAIENIDFETSLPRATVRLLRTLFDDDTSSEDDLLHNLENMRDKDVLNLIQSMSESYITATLIKAGARNKGLPQGKSCEAIFDARLLPNITKEELEKKLRTVVESMAVTIEVESFSKGYEADTEKNIVALFEKILKSKNEEISALLPFITPGSNDGRFLKDMGSTVFGFAPLCDKDEFVEIIKGIHSIDERILLESIDFNEAVLSEIIKEYLTGDEYVG